MPTSDSDLPKTERIDNQPGTASVTPPTIPQHKRLPHYHEHCGLGWSIVGGIAFIFVFGIFCGILCLVAYGVKAAIVLCLATGLWTLITGKVYITRTVVLHPAAGHVVGGLLVGVPLSWLLAGAMGQLHEVAALLAFVLGALSVTGALMLYSKKAVGQYCPTRYWTGMQDVAQGKEELHASNDLGDDVP